MNILNGKLLLNSQVLAVVQKASFASENMSIIITIMIVIIIILIIATMFGNKK